MAERLELQAPPGPMERTARLSPCGRYRYDLTRRWREGPAVLYVMLNPSIADADRDDLTVTKCVGFAHRWGFGAIRVVNLFAFRATNPAELRAAADPIGPDNSLIVADAIYDATLVVAGWGAWYGTHAIDLPARIDVVSHAEMSRVPLRCLGTTRAGAPRHPSRLAYATPLEPWP